MRSLNSSGANSKIELDDSGELEGSGECEDPEELDGLEESEVLAESEEFGLPDESSFFSSVEAAVCRQVSCFL